MSTFAAEHDGGSVGVGLEVSLGILATLLFLVSVYQGLALGGVFGRPFFYGIIGGLLPFIGGVLSTLCFLRAYRMIR